MITYSTDKNMASNLETITAKRAWEVIRMNKEGEKPLSLVEDGKAKPAPKSKDLLAEADLSRFDKAKKKKKKPNKQNNNRPQQGERKQGKPTGEKREGKPKRNTKDAMRQKPAEGKAQPANGNNQAPETGKSNPSKEEN